MHVSAYIFSLKTSFIDVCFFTKSIIQDLKKNFEIVKLVTGSLISCHRLAASVAGPGGLVGGTLVDGRYTYREVLNPAFLTTLGAWKHDVVYHWPSLIKLVDVSFWEFTGICSVWRIIALVLIHNSDTHLLGIITAFLYYVAKVMEHHTLQVSLQSL